MMVFVLMMVMPTAAIVAMFMVMFVVMLFCVFFIFVRGLFLRVRAGACIVMFMLKGQEIHSH